MGEKTRKDVLTGDLLFPEESFVFMGAAFEVYQTLGPGFLEVIYELAITRELERRKIPFRRQVPFEVFYKGESLEKQYVCDLLIFEKIIIELKAIREISNVQIAQALNYLKVTNLELAIILNFSAPDKLEWKRVIRSVQ
jgi:GxxExxY protein